MMNEAIADRIRSLRELMKSHHIDAFVVPSADPHQSEYVAESWKCRAWVSGFSGSGGTVAVMKECAGLWADGRYFIQAEQELKGSGIDLFKMQMAGVPRLIDWLSEQVPEKGTVAVDGRQLTAADAEAWRRTLGKKKIGLRLDLDFISELWTDRPAPPRAAVLRHGVEYAGRTAPDKLEEIRTAMQEKGADHYLLSSLDDIAWLFNIRGGDILHCPVVLAHALVMKDEAVLFMDEAKLGDAVRGSLEDEGIQIAPYDSMADALAALTPGTSILIDDGRVNAHLRQAIPSACSVINERQLTALPKARKNTTELQNWRRVQELDGAAMVRFWKWLEEEMPSGDVTECSAADRLEAFRRARAECVDLSFSPISAYGPNAAMTHYSPYPESCATLESRGLYLIDSGGQYSGGTTDITRTLTLGELSDEQKTDYTLVLKGMINLSRARFLKGAAGNNLDILARQPLWAHGLDYQHGTGHGVGYYLNVHEGPQNISPHKRSDTPLEPGMVLTIEPGVYKEDRHGIRTENMVVVEEDGETEFGSFYRFSTLTLCPIDTTPLKLELLSPGEIKWLNEYHQTVREKLTPHLNKAEAAWLKTKTKPISAG
jgi:Xaa-Pro aminopeptidase